MGKYRLEIHSASDSNMSTWQITHTVNTLTAVNNKFDILNTLNKYINSGISKRNIFIMDKSYLFSTNYSTYFSDECISQTGTAIDIDKICNMGRIIPMQQNKSLTNINALLELYRKLNSILNRNLKCRLRKVFLFDAYDCFFAYGMDKARACLVEGAKSQVCDIFERRMKPDYQHMQNIIQSCDRIKMDVASISKYDYTDEECERKFSYYFNSCARPIIGIYDESNHIFEIVNAEQIYKNGEDAKEQIKLTEITKNSPVLIAFTVVGVMGSVLTYLAYRDHKVNNIINNEDIFDIPTERRDAIKNVFANNGKGILETPSTCEVDIKILNLGIDTYCKLENVTNPTKVRIDYMRQEEKI